MTRKSNDAQIVQIACTAGAIDVTAAKQALPKSSATARDDSFDADLKPGAIVRTTASSGTFAFFCKFHPTVQATLVVK